jgi:hypothetical protein
MINRIFFVGAAALILSASSAGAQGQPQKQVVISKAVLKSMVANKPKTKKPLGARAGLVRRSSVVAAKPEKAAPTSVRAIKPIPERK